MNNPVRYMDAYGLECINLFNPVKEPMMYAGAQAECERVDPGRKSPDLNVFGHGGPDVICPPLTTCASAGGFNNKYRKYIERSRSIYLWACNVGRRRNGFAQSLANLSGKPVTGPDNYTWWNDEGMTAVAGREPTWREWFEDLFGEQHMGANGLPNHHGPRDTNDPGSFQTFYPQR